MIWLLLSLALAQDPQEFRPVPGSEVVDGETLEGILIDEETYKELGKLRVDVKTQAVELEAFEDWKITQDRLFVDSLRETQQSCQEGMVELQQHYDRALEKTQKKDSLQRHAMPVGIAIGVVTSAAVFGLSLKYYGEVLRPGM